MLPTTGVAHAPTAAAASSLSACLLPSVDVWPTSRTAEPTVVVHPKAVSLSLQPHDPPASVHAPSSPDVVSAQDKLSTSPSGQAAAASLCARMLPSRNIWPASANVQPHADAAHTWSAEASSSDKHAQNPCVQCAADVVAVVSAASLTLRSVNATTDSVAASSSSGHLIATGVSTQSTRLALSSEHSARTGSTCSSRASMVAASSSGQGSSSNSSARVQYQPVHHYQLPAGALSRKYKSVVVMLSTEAAENSAGSRSTDAASPAVEDTSSAQHARQSREMCSLNVAHLASLLSEPLAAPLAEYVITELLAAEMERDPTLTSM